MHKLVFIFQARRANNSFTCFGREASALVGWQDGPTHFINPLIEPVLLPIADTSYCFRAWPPNDLEHVVSFWEFQITLMTLGDLFRKEGGTVINERAMKLIPREGGGWMVMTNLANRSTDHVVVAMGAWSRQLLDPLGIKVVLETERGYHAMLFDPEVMPALPISNKTRAFGVTPMEDGLRVAGTVEIAGLEAPPNEERAKVLVQHAKRMFPALRAEKVRYWMGFRPSTPDSLPILGPSAGRPGLHFVFGHGHFGMTGGPPSGRLVARLITGQAPGLDPAPYAAQRFG